MPSSTDAPVSHQALLSSLPPEWPHDPRSDIQDQVHNANRRIVVLDDDPTGT